MGQPGASICTDYNDFPFPSHSGITVLLGIPGSFFLSAIQSLTCTTAGSRRFPWGPATVSVQPGLLPNVTTFTPSINNPGWSFLTGSCNDHSAQ
jgi:hypothetical protein